jgi:hypothetical protein
VVGGPWSVVLLLLGPLAWTAHLLLSYPLLPVACGLGGPLLLHGVTLATALPTAWALRVAWRRWRATRDDPRSGTTGVATGNRPFMAFSAILMNGVFLFAILLEGLPPFFLSPCG